MSKKLYIGIAGYMGSGKSTCSKFFSERYGFSVVDADLEAKKFIKNSENIKEKLIETFGNNIIENNTLSFRKLSKIVFNDIEKLRLLNSIVHPPLIKFLRTIFFSETSSKAIVLDAALIPLWQIEDWFNLRIWVHADLEIRIKRLMAKETELSENDLKNRAILQMKLFDEPSEEKWIYLCNEGTLEELMNKLFFYIRTFFK